MNKVTRTDTPANIQRVSLIGMIAGADVVRMEGRRGTQELTKANQLPIDGFYQGGARADQARTAFQAAGGVVVGPTQGDPLFCDVHFPEGWTLQADKGDPHGRGSYLVDNNGRRRGSIFYKAAFYDRKAGFSPSTRLSYTYRCVDYDVRPSVYYGVITDGQNDVWRGTLFKDLPEAERRAHFEKLRASGESVMDFQFASDKARNEAAEVLLKAFPRCVQLGRLLGSH